MSPMLRLVAPILFLLHQVAAFGDDDNYMRQSGMFASISTIEDMLFPESVMLKKLEQYHDRLDGSLKVLKRYLEAWHELDLEQDIEDGSSSRERYLDTHKTALKNKEAELRKKMLKFQDKARTDRLRGDSAMMHEGKIVDDDNHDEDVVDSEIEKLEQEVDEARDQYEWLTSEFPVNETDGSSSAVGGRLQTTFSGGGVQHPVDAYLLMKRLTVNWAAVSGTLQNLRSDTFSVLDEIDEQREKFMFPTTADLHGAAVALVRLQDVYGLNMASMGDGVIPARVSHDNKEVRSIGRLRVWDYILLGKQAFLLNYFHRAIHWFKMAVKASETEQLEGDELDVIPKLKETIERHETASLEDKSKGNDKKKKKKKKKNSAKKRTRKLHQVLTPEEDAVHQKLLCRGEKFISPEYESSLSCRLERLQSSYLLLMPLQMEELHHSPKIVLFHNFLTDSQINYMVKRAKPNLGRSTHGTTNGQDVSMIRVSMTGWVAEDFTRNDPLTKITRKIQEATNMEVVKHGDSEEYQVANYGIGGLYNSHTDYGVASTAVKGDRLATFLIYLSHVGAGGTTVFTRLGVRATPQRGAALFWYNLFTDGSGDHLTHHAACPVLHGSKWITTKWIRYNSQFRKRACGLRPAERFHYP